MPNVVRHAKKTPMKKIFYILCFVFYGSLCFGQNKPFILHDTTFLLRDLNKDGTYHRIYFDNTRTDKFYELIRNYKWESFDTTEYLRTIGYLKERNPYPFIKQDLRGVSQHWFPLYLYEGVYYLFSPIEWLIDGRIDFNDTTFINYTWEGPEASLLKSFKQIDKKTYQINYIKNHVYHTDTIQQKLKIHIIDKEKGISIFEYCSMDGKNKDYKLMVSADKVKLFPLINDYNGGDRMLYTNNDHPPYFDKPDFEKLINKK